MHEAPAARMDVGGGPAPGLVVDMSGAMKSGVQASRRDVVHGGFTQVTNQELQDGR